MADELRDLRVKIYADGADLASLLALAEQPHISGFTTNPTLMRKAGVADYAAFAREVLDRITDRPISFEVFADDADGMRSQAHEIASWGSNVYVKIPVTTTRGEPMAELVRELSLGGVQLNVTALMTVAQVRTIAAALSGGAPANISVFAGRIADTGRDPVPLMRAALAAMASAPNAELIWASPREVLNVVQADQIGCHIITVTHDLLGKLHVLGKDLDEFSLETVRMFHDDARAAGYALEPAEVGRG
jgi:transaldolase